MKADLKEVLSHLAEVKVVSLALYLPQAATAVSIWTKCWLDHVNSPDFSVESGIQEHPSIVTKGHTNLSTGLFFGATGAVRRTQSI